MAASIGGKSACSSAQQRFKYCELCRHSHDQGKRHVFTRSHKDKIKHVLGKYDAKVKLARQDLKEPCVLAGSFEPDRKYWCNMCACEVEKHVTDGEMTVRHAGFIEHLMSSEHARQVDRFWRVNRIQTDLQPKFVFSGELQATYKKAVEDALRKQEEEQQQLTSESAAKIRRLESNRLQLLQPSSSCTFSSSETVASMQLQVNPSAESGSRPMSSNGPIVMEGCCEGSGLKDVAQCSSWSDTPTCQTNGSPVNTPTAMSSQYQKDPDLSGSNQYQSTMKSYGVLSRVKTVGVISSGGLSVIKVKDRGMAGNVHSGARPPWLEVDNQPECQELGPSEDNFKKHLEWQKKSKLNPGRVGANFDHASLSSEDWLPSFGRVWNAGRRWQSRRQYRKEVNNSRSLAAPSMADQPMKN